MNDLKQILAQLKLKVVATRQQLEEEEAAIRVLERMLNIEPAPTENRSLAENPTAPYSPPTTSSVRTHTAIPKKVSLIDNIRELLPTLGDQEFTVAHLDVLLEQRGQKPKTRTQISMAFAKLAEHGEIIKVADGAGNMPHVFKVA